MRQRFPHLRHYKLKGQTANDAFQFLQQDSQEKRSHLSNCVGISYIGAQFYDLRSVYPMYFGYGLWYQLDI